MERLRGTLRDEFGQSMVELALLLPILVFGLIGAADLARAFAIQIAIENPMIVRIDRVKYVMMASRPYSANRSDRRCLSDGLPAGGAGTSSLMKLV